MEQASINDALGNAVVGFATQVFTAVSDAVTMRVLRYAIRVVTVYFWGPSPVSSYDVLRLAYYIFQLVRVPQAKELCRLVASWFTYDGPAWDISAAVGGCVWMLAVYVVTFLIVDGLRWYMVWYLFNWPLYFVVSVAVGSVWYRLKVGSSVADAILLGLPAFPVLISLWSTIIFTLYRNGHPVLFWILSAAGVAWLIIPSRWKPKIRSYVLWILIRGLEFLLYPPLISGRFVKAVFIRSRRWVRHRWRLFVMQPSTAGNAMLYEYKNLLSEDCEIRLIKLKRMKNRTLSCELLSFPLKLAPSYDAISYTWGNPARNHGVYVDKKWLPLTASAHGILQDRASFTTTKYLWIDLICINQSDNMEKASQVQMMKEIFSTAARVVVWLGTATDADMAVSFIEGFYSNIIWGRTVPPGLATDSTRIPDSRSPAFITLMNHPYWFRAWVVQEVAVARLIHISYDGILFHWDHLEVLSRAIGDPSQWSLIPYVSLLNNWPGPTGFSQISTMSDLRKLTITGFDHRFFDIAAETWRFKATDPRDKIYSLMGISDGEKHPDLNPDYEKSVADVYHDATCFLLGNESPLKILSVAGLGGNDRILSLPSWVPDWSSLPLMAPLGPRMAFGDTSLYNASGASKLVMELDRVHHLLKLDGFKLDTISKLGAPMANLPPNNPTDKEAYGTQTMLDDGDAWQLATDLPSIYVTGQPKLASFWRTLLGDAVFSAEEDIPSILSAPVFANAGPRKWKRPAPEVYGDYYNAHVKLATIFRQFTKAKQDLPPDLRPGIEAEAPRPKSPEELKDLENLKSIADEFLAVNSDEHEAGRREFSFAMGGCASGRRFAVTAHHGYMAMVPPNSQIGDTICVIYGAAVPFVLRCCRPSSPEGGEGRGTGTEYQGGESGSGGGVRARLVGECYVHGMMDGEALALAAEANDEQRVETFVLY